jgi:hypothetical protein
MGRKPKYDRSVYKIGTQGNVSHNRKDLVGEFFGKVDASGAVYISKALKGYKTVTYVFKNKDGDKVDNSGDK